MSTAITTHAHATPAEDKAPTPSAHASTSKAKPVRLLALDDGPQGKTALLEFPEGWQRIIALPTQADAWHPLFDDLTNAERGRLRAHVDHPVIRHPDGTRTKQGALSFITKEISRVGSWTGERCFDVPPRTITRVASRATAVPLNCWTPWRVATGRTSSSNTSSRRHCRPAMSLTASHHGAVLALLSWKLSREP